MMERAPKALDERIASHLEVLWPATDYSLEIREGILPTRRGGAYTMLPSAKNATLLVPTASARVAASTLVRYGSSAKRMTRYRSRALAIIARLGLFRLFPGKLMVVAKSGDGASLVDHISSELGEPLVASVRLGPARANRKPVLTLMRPNGDVVGYAKVGTSSLTRLRIDQERSALARLANASLTRLVVPSILLDGSWREANYITISPIGGGGKRIESVTRDLAARELVLAFERQAHALIESKWWRRLAERAKSLDGSDGVRLVEAIDTITAIAGDWVIEFGAQHGDWTPWNIVTIGERTHAWDWEQFGESVPVGLDQFHYSYHSAVTGDGLSPGAALEHLRQESTSLVAVHDIPRDRSTLLCALFVVSTGERFLTDRQEAAGSRKGPPRDWLFPALDAILEDLSDSR